MIMNNTRDLTKDPTSRDYSLFCEVIVEDGVPKFRIAAENEVMAALRIDDQVIKTSVFHQISRYIERRGWATQAEDGLEDATRIFDGPAEESFERLRSLRAMLCELVELADRHLDSGERELETSVTWV